MASLYSRGVTKWIKFTPPGSNEPCRKSLGRMQDSMAALILRRLELELELRRPELRLVELPSPILEMLGGRAQESAKLEADAPPPLVEVSNLSIWPPAAEVLAAYVAHCTAEHDRDHVANKISYLKKFFGSRLLGCSDKTIGVFKGHTLEEVKPADVQKMIDSLPLAKKTKRHHRNAFHSFFEFAMKCGFYQPSNFRYPNPMSALPTYHEKNKKIVYLSNVQIEEDLRILEPHPSVRIAAALMIYAGLRRAETLWLKRENFSDKLKFISVVNKTDEEKDIESSLKTGERAVPILPPLKAILLPYLETLEGEWLCPSPRGHQWDGDNFGAKHRTLLKQAGLHHTCLHYRHTFATQRAAQGWSLFKIAKCMGNSVAVCEKYYAAFVDPSKL